MKFIITLLLLILTNLGHSQRFPTPPSSRQINNQLMSQHNQMMQQQQMMRMLQNRVVTNEEKLVNETTKKEKFEQKQEELDIKLTQLTEELVEIDNNKDLSLEEKTKKTNKINKEIDKTLDKIEKNSEKIKTSEKKIEGLEHIDKVIDIDQSPIGRTPRSNPATYTDVFSEIRSLFTQTPEAQIRGYKPGRFSFNVKGGRCETCEGSGVRTIEMSFLTDVYVECETCQGKRFNRETLEIRYKGKSISDVLTMTVDEAVDFFENIPKIYRKVKTIQDVGLGYITLGQQSTTLSGGEAQRVKLATELSKKDTGNTFYILDEPTTGLHFEDIRVLMEVINKLVKKGNTVLIIEHNLDVVKLADHIIDIGYEGGKGGGQVVAMGTPEEIIKNKKSYTAQFLKKELS